jgi:hypothetical protein
MIRSKLGLLGLCATVLSVMAISASAAQAAGSWLVGTTEITKTSTLPAELTVEIDTLEPKLLTHLVGLIVTVTCTKVMSSPIFRHDGEIVDIVVSTGCTVEAKDSKGNKSGNCTVKSTGVPTGTIASEDLKGEAVLHELTGGAKDVLAKIESETIGEPLTTIHFEGAECLLPLSTKVTGVLYIKDCEGFAETLKVKHLIEQGPLTSLSVGADNAEHLLTSIDGSFWAKMTGVDAGQEWRAMGV